MRDPRKVFPVPGGPCTGRFDSARPRVAEISDSASGARRPDRAERISAEEQIVLARKALETGSDQLRFFGPEV